MQILGVVLLVLGILAIVYGGFWYEKEEVAAEIGPLEVKVEKRERVNIPLWAGIVTTVVGAVVLGSGLRRRPA